MAVGFDLVAAAFFCHIQTLVSEIDQLEYFVPLQRKHRDALADRWGRDLIPVAPGDFEFAHPQLDAFRHMMSVRAIRAWHYATAEGLVVASSAPEAIGTTISDRDYYRQITVCGRDWSISNAIPGKFTDKPVVVVARGIRDAEGLRGMVLAVVAPDDLGDLPLAGLQRKEGAAYGIFDAEGNMVFRAAASLWIAAGFGKLLPRAVCRPR